MATELAPLRVTLAMDMAALPEGVEKLAVCALSISHVLLPADGRKTNMTAVVQLFVVWFIENTGLASQVPSYRHQNPCADMTLAVVSA
jgi:hypothetical protein